MKKLLFAVLFSLSTMLVYAQDESSSSFRLGLTAHPNFGWIKSDIETIKSDGLRAGFTYGLLGDFYFAENYAFSSGLLLSTINGQTKSTNGDQNILKIQYIEIPAKLKLKTGQTNNLSFFGEFGLGNGFCVRAKQDVKSSTPADNVKGQDIYSDVAFYRASLIIGGGAEFNVGEKTVVLAGLTFDNGFTDINSSNGTLKSAYIGLNLAVFF